MEISRGPRGIFPLLLTVATSIGKITGNAQLNSGAASDSADYRWKADVVAEEFNVGQLLGDTESFGPVTVEGIGSSEPDCVKMISKRGWMQRWRKRLSAGIRTGGFRFTVPSARKCSTGRQRFRIQTSSSLSTAR